ncbi:hypothetical protein EDD29_4206 [Actinocorallia herbida]|uniref:Uncharacterized protein n=1 Tax=Actinocorallia herbida TaxID=58109 RepID=A0A3N1CZF3_9ACTN|nr:hypothetical protein EDD29_4206 [Actinocorallia herbida]
MLLLYVQPWVTNVIPPPPTPTPKFQGEAVKVTKVTPVEREDDHSWLLPGPTDDAAVVALNREIDAAGGLGSRGGDRAMREFGAVEARYSTVEVELEGNRAGPVRITDIRAVADCSEPLSGTYFDGSPQGGEKVVKIGFDLDSRSPVAQKMERRAGEDEPRFAGPYFADEKYSLHNGEQLTVRLTARAFNGFCEYRYELELIVAGKPTTQLFPSKSDEPFRVSGFHVLRGYENLPPYARSQNVDCTRYQSVYAGGFYQASQPDTPWVPSKDAEHRCTGQGG